VERLQFVVEKNTNKVFFPSAHQNTNKKHYLTMKPILSLTFSFFLFVLIVNLSLDFPNDALEQVLDVTNL
jgi:hypothetical protein